MPYHIVIEVAYDQREKKNGSSLGSPERGRFSLASSNPPMKSPSLSKTLTERGGSLNKYFARSKRKAPSQFIEMQVFNTMQTQTDKKDSDFTEKTASSKIFSDEDKFHYVNPNLLVSSDESFNLNPRKSRSLDTDRNNVNTKKYRLDNHKISKDYTQDFLEEYSEIKPQPQAIIKNLSSKVYESDTNIKSSQENGGSSSDAYQVN